MNASDLIRRLHRHRLWVNRRLLETVRPLTDDQLRQSFAIAEYTTAQLVNMLRQLGVTPLADVMLISLARQEANP